MCALLGHEVERLAAASSRLEEGVLLVVAAVGELAEKTGVVIVPAARGVRMVVEAVMIVVEVAVEVVVEVGVVGVLVAESGTCVGRAEVDDVADAGVAGAVAFVRKLSDLASACGTGAVGVMVPRRLLLRW